MLSRPPTRCNESRELDESKRFDTLLLYLVRPRPEKQPERIELKRPLHDESALE